MAAVDENDTRWEDDKTNSRWNFASVAGSDMCTSEIIFVHKMHHFRRGESYYLHEKWNVHCNVPFSRKRAKSIMPSLKGMHCTGLLLSFFPSCRVWLWFHSNNGVEVNFIERSQPMSIHDSTTSSSSSFAFSCFFNFNKMLHSGASAHLIALKRALLLGRGYFTGQMKHMRM